MNLPVRIDSNVCVNYSPREVSDELLVLAAKSGDAVAFVELSNRHSSKILRTVYRITRNREDAEDVLQDSFLKAFLHLKKFESRSSFSSWLTRIAINSALMILRRRRSHNEVSIDDTNDHLGTCDRWESWDCLEDPERRCERREREELLNGAIVQLRPDLRNVIELRYAHGCSVAELAKSLGISMAAAKSRLLRARNALRASLQ